MAMIFPVILCGGAGSRLWPESRPETPKQFLPLLGDLSLFQQTARRVAPLAADGGRVIVVAGVAHREVVEAQLAAVGVAAHLILEPEGRNSGPAIAAAALWSATRHPEAVNVVVASDHWIPDTEAFRAAAQDAVTLSADGLIVTLGVAPRGPSSAYGYIRSAGPGSPRVAAFVEKPDEATARRLIAEGCLWNSGNFIAAADTLVAGIDSHAPDIGEAVRAAVAGGVDAGGALLLGPAFAAAPGLSFDHAVMEATDRAGVLRVDFEWSDLGAWDAIEATGRGDRGRSIQLDCANLLVRAPTGVTVVTIGVENLAVVVTADGVLVCPLDQTQGVKDAVARMDPARDPLRP